MYLSKDPIFFMQRKALLVILTYNLTPKIYEMNSLLILWTLLNRLVLGRMRGTSSS